MRDTALLVDERADLERHEATIARGLDTFMAVGEALAAIRDGRLYRLSHATFEDYCRERWGLKRQRAYELMGAAGVAARLSEICDTPPRRESHASPLAALPPPQQSEAWQRAVQTAPNGKVTAAHVAATVEAIKGEPPAALVASASAEWYTPTEYVEAVRAALGAIDLDPASTEHANRVVKAARFFTRDDDGLARAWPGRVYLNPPYGTEGGESNQARWSRRLVEQHRVGVTVAAVLLVNATPSNLWWEPLARFPVCFTRGRIRFYNEAGPAEQPTHSNAFVYLGPSPERFFDAFRPIGWVYRPEGA